MSINSTGAFTIQNVATGNFVQLDRYPGGNLRTGPREGAATFTVTQTGPLYVLRETTTGFEPAPSSNLETVTWAAQETLWILHVRPDSLNIQLAGNAVLVWNDVNNSVILGERGSHSNWRIIQAQ